MKLTKALPPAACLGCLGRTTFFHIVQPDIVSLFVVANLKCLDTFFFFNLGENKNRLSLWALPWLCFLCAEKQAESLLYLPHLQSLIEPPALFRKAYLNMLREAKAAPAPRAHFDRCRSEALFFLSWKPYPPDVGKGASFLCLMLLMPVVMLVLFSLGLEVDLQCFRRPVGKKKKEN